MVDGDGDPTNDLDNEETLSDGGPYWYSNYVAMWQAMLWSESLLSQGGPTTANATRAYQGPRRLLREGDVLVLLSLHPPRPGRAIPGRAPA